MRVTLFSKFDMMKHHMNNIQQRTVEQRNQIATGKRFENISEDPVRANQVMIIKNSMGKIEQLQKNINDAESFLKTSESTLGTTIDVLQNAREQGLKAKNDTFSTEDKNTFADMVEQNIQQVLTLSNTKYLGKHLFSGEKTQTNSFSYDGLTATYQGDLDVPKMKVSPSMEMEISENGQEAFQSVFDSLIALRDEIRTGTNADIQNAIEQLDVATNKVTDTRSGLGVKMTSLEMLNEGYESEKLGLETKRTNIEEVDFTKIMMEYANTERIYQGMLASSNKMFQNSLINYI